MAQTALRLVSIATVVVSLSMSAPNVLYILSDDMRADLGTYGLPTVTPNIDALAASGLRFTHSFCQISVCSPSRQSFLTGRRPDRSQVWNFIDSNPLNTTATPGWFRDHGYLALGAGKTFHEDNGAWNADAYWNLTVRPYFAYASNVCPHGGEGGGHCTFPDYGEAEQSQYDYKLLNTSLEYLSFAAQHWKETGTPFFVAVGFRDPHGPWASPERMTALYDEDSIAVAKFPTLGTDTPLIAWSSEWDVMLQNGTSFPFGPYKPVPDWVQRDQRHAYYSAVSWVDEHVGFLLDELKVQGADQDTIVIFHSDHGYMLSEVGGRHDPPHHTHTPVSSSCALLFCVSHPLLLSMQHGYWEKKSNFDLTVRVPLIIRVPGKAASHGAVTNSFVDLVDVFPTLVALAGLPTPPGTDGDDFSSLFDDPTQMLKTEAYHQYPGCGMTSFNQTRAECNGTPRTQFNYMGYSMRNQAWRYTRWLVWRNSSLTSDWDGDFVDELYAHTGDDSTDMDAWENVNVAASNPDIVKNLFGRLRTFFDRKW